MRRMQISMLVTLILGALICVLSVPFALNVAGFSVPVRQAPVTTTILRRIQVNAQTIKALPTGRKYVADLTQRGVLYEFNSATSAIDFTRVMVRTAQGEVAIGSWLETTFLKEKLATLKWASQSFSIGTRPTGTVTAPSTSRLNFNCKYSTCTCEGGADCIDLIFNTDQCGDTIFCVTNPITGTKICSCARKF